MEEKCMGLKNEVALQEKQTGDVDRQLDETTRELHREREKLMAVIRMSGDLIFEYDIVNDKMYYAGPGEGILYSRQITEGYTDQLLKEAGNRTETVEQQLAEALRSGKPDIYIELCKTDAEGKPRWVKVIGQTFYDEKGEPERVLGKVCDIDEQKKKEWATCCNAITHWLPKEVAAHIVSAVPVRYVPPYVRPSNRDGTSRISKQLYL